MHWLFHANKLNKLRGRIYPQVPLNGNLFGFKFHFRGRFSRKQRAGSYIIERGNMPLTTLSVTVDYGFITVPLVNSIVSIKVWLFKNPFAEDLFFEKISDRNLFKASDISNTLSFQHIKRKLKFNYWNWKKKNDIERNSGIALSSFNIKTINNEVINDEDINDDFNILEKKPKIIEKNLEKEQVDLKEEQKNFKRYRIKARLLKMNRLGEPIKMNLKIKNFIIRPNCLIIKEILNGVDFGVTFSEKKFKELDEVNPYGRTVPYRIENLLIPLFFFFFKKFTYSFNRLSRKYFFSKLKKWKAYQALRDKNYMIRPIRPDYEWELQRSSISLNMHRYLSSYNNLRTFVLQEYYYDFERYFIKYNIDIQNPKAVKKYIDDHVQPFYRFRWKWANKEIQKNFEKKLKLQKKKRF